jgi:hypothetical protein
MVPTTRNTIADARRLHKVIATDCPIKRREKSSTEPLKPSPKTPAKLAKCLQEIDASIDVPASQPTLVDLLFEALSYRNALAEFRVTISVFRPRKITDSIPQRLARSRFDVTKIAPASRINWLSGAPSAPRRTLRTARG